MEPVRTAGPRFTIWMLLDSSAWRWKMALPEAAITAFAEEGIPFCQIAEVIGRRLNVPVTSKQPGEVAKHLASLHPSSV